MVEQEPPEFAALERRVRALEQSATPSTPKRAAQDAGSSRWWVLERLANNTSPEFEHDGIAGSIVYGGQTRTPGGGELVWQAEHPLPDVLNVDLHLAAAVLAALAHPVRLEILRHLLLGAHTLAELQQIPGIGTSGQLHHHLRELRTAGLTVHRRNHYTLTPERVVPWLVIIASAAGPTGVIDPATRSPSKELNTE